MLPSPPAPTEGRPPVPRRARGRRLLGVAAAVAVFVIARRSGATELLADQNRLRDVVDQAGWLGPVVFTGLFTALVPVGVPGLVFVLPAALVFPAPLAVVVCLVGGYTSSGIGVWFSRTVGREAVAAKLPPRFRRWDDAIARRGLVAVIALRLVTYLAAPADWLLGVSAIPTRKIVIGTAIGLIPPTLLYVIAGGGVLDLIWH